MLCRICGFQGGDYEECRLLGCYAVWLFEEELHGVNIPEDGILQPLKLIENLANI
jgi:hypothetical protein